MLPGRETKMINMIHSLTNSFLLDGTPGSGAELAAKNVSNITAGIKLFLGPIVLLIISGVSISFLLKREMKKFIQFAVLTVAVGVFFYVPNIIEPIAKSIAGLFGN